MIYFASSLCSNIKDLEVGRLGHILVSVSFDMDQDKTSYNYKENEVNKVPVIDILVGRSFLMDRTHEIIDRENSLIVLGQKLLKDN